MSGSAIMIKVGISGANGTMGRLTIGAIDAVDDLTIGGLYAPGRDHQDILGYRASGDPAALSECDVVIELTKQVCISGKFRIDSCRP